MQHDPEPLYPKAMAMPHLTLLVSERDHIQGSANAALTLVEYRDYECPYCALAYPVVKDIQRQLGPTLRFVFRYFPLTHIHPHARHAAEAKERATPTHPQTGKTGKHSQSSVENCKGAEKRWKQ